MNTTDFFVSCHMEQDGRGENVFHTFDSYKKYTSDQAIACVLEERFMFPILHSTLVSQQTGNGAKVNRKVGNHA